MKKRSVIAAIVCLTMIITSILLPGVRAKAYDPPVDTFKVGLRYGDNAVSGANLENEVGSGFRFGYFDNSRNFVALGAETDLERISVVRDSNVFYSSDGSYYAGTGSTTVGCYHIMLNGSYSGYSEARNQADYYDGGFVRYDGSGFRVLVGNYTSAGDASAAAASRGISGFSVDEGTTSTVAVVETGTSRILFEFDGGSSKTLGVMPRSSGKAQTWFRGYTYYGGFQFQRITGGSVTVVNVVDIEDYVKGVIPYEMSASWPHEALKVQACCARTYAMCQYHDSKHTGFDICNSTCCQVYYGTGSANDNSDSAVDETAGEYITYSGKLCETYYSASNGGASESSKNVWGGDYAYLQGVVDPYEKDIADFAYNYYWSMYYSNESLSDRLADWGYISWGDSVTGLQCRFSDVGNVIGITVYYVTSSGTHRDLTISGGSRVGSVLNTDSIHFTINGEPRPVGEGSGDSSGGVYVNDGTALSGSLEDAYAVGDDGTYSIGSGTVWALTGDGSVAEVTGGGSSGGGSGGGGGGPGEIHYGEYYIEGTGWGHNVGMSQWGAYSQAKYYGRTYDQIIKFYYTGVTIG